MNKYIVLSLSALVIFFTSCATTKRQYPTSNYQCEKTGEIFEISNTIDEENLICPDKTCGGKLVKVASYKRYGSGLNTRYGYSDPWRVGYSGPYVTRRSFLVWAFIVEAIIIIIIITMITKTQNPQNLNLKVSRKEYPLNQVGPLLQIIQPVEVVFQKAFPIDQMHHHLAIQEAKKFFKEYT